MNNLFIETLLLCFFTDLSYIKRYKILKKIFLVLFYSLFSYSVYFLGRYKYLAYLNKTNPLSFNLFGIVLIVNTNKTYLICSL